jgi:hypothetical protein
MRNRILAILMFGVLASHTAYAQVPTDDPFTEASIRIGAVAFDPRIVVTNFGVDTNVFNTVDDPQQDFTFAMKPGTDMFFRTGRGLFTVVGNLEFVYFAEFESERSVNSDVLGRYEFRFNRLRPYASASWLDTNQRPGYEIDIRARHYEAEYHAGIDLRVGSKSALRVDFRHLDYTFAGDEVLNGQALNEQLNRTQRAIELGWRQRLTVLTTWIVRGSRETERFAYEDFRNANSFRVSSGFELAPLALIRGSAFVGFRSLAPAAGGMIPEFSGVSADVDIAYTTPTQTRLAAAIDRDIQYSYQDRTPYYVQTGWTATLTQRITGRLDVQFSGGRDRLAYQALISAVDERTDLVRRFGGGIGYTFGEQMRISFDVNSYQRSSVLPGLEYRGVRAGVSVNYGN